MTAKDIKHLGIIGAGMIGITTAVLSTSHGVKTTVVDIFPDKIPEYQAKFDTFYKEMVSKGLMTEAQSKICGKYVKFTDKYEELADCDFVFEASTENIDIKHQIYAKLEELCPNIKAIFSGSSSFVPDVLCEKAKKYKDRIVVAHPFFPVHMVPYFEICAASSTDPAATQAVYDCLEALDRKPVILKKPAPGFIGNRLQFALWREALYMMESGIADLRDIDRCLNYSFCPRYTSIGMFEHFDNGGLTLNITTCDTVWPTLGDYTQAPPAITDRIARGDTGAKAESKTGFYDWNGVDMVAYQERVNAPYWKFINWEFPSE